MYRRAQEPSSLAGLDQEVSLVPSRRQCGAANNAATIRHAPTATGRARARAPQTTLPRRCAARPSGTSTTWAPHPAFAHAFACVAGYEREAPSPPKRRPGALASLTGSAASLSLVTGEPPDLSRPFAGERVSVGRLSDGDTVLWATILPLVILGGFGNASRASRREPSWRRLGRLVGLLGVLEEPERADDTVAGLDQVVALEALSLLSFGTRVSLTLPVSSTVRFWSTPS